MWKIKGGRCIYQSPNGAKIYQNLLYRWLTFDNRAIQTLINRRHPERSELSYIKQLTLAVRAKPVDCCLLGLGGAAVAHLLAPYLGASQLIAIEHDVEIIEIAKNYFMIDRLKNMMIIHQDANIFVQQCNVRYQHLMIDLFNAHSFPAHCNTYNFFSNCKRIVLANGILAVNLANLQEQWPVFQLIREIFNQQTVSLPVKGTANMVILAYNGESITPLINLIKKTTDLKKLSWDATWGCIAEI